MSMWIFYYGRSYDIQDNPKESLKWTIKNSKRKKNVTFISLEFWGTKNPSCLIPLFHFQITADTRSYTRYRYPQKRELGGKIVTLDITFIVHALTHTQTHNHKGINTCKHHPTPLRWNVYAHIRDWIVSLIFEVNIKQICFSGNFFAIQLQVYVNLILQ